MRFKKVKYVSHFENINFTLLKKTFIRNGHKVHCLLKSKFPIFLKFKKLRFKLKQRSGRSHTGRIILWTRKSTLFKKVKYKLNFTFRYSFISFIASIFLEPNTLKVISILFFSSGAMSYILASHKHSLFTLIKMYKPQIKLKDVHYRLKKTCYSIVDYVLIKQNLFFINHLPRHQPISLLELVAGSSIQYVRASGVFAIMSKLDIKTSTAIIKLPSGVRKIFSSFSLGSLGVNPHKLKKYWTSNKAGYFSNLGCKPKVRGVARNPVDHPHGGRTKTLRYPRTPWGLTTKFK